MNLIMFFRNGQTTWALKASMIERWGWACKDLESGPTAADRVVL